MENTQNIIEQKCVLDSIYNQQEGIYYKIAQSAGMAEIPYRIMYALCEHKENWSQIDICRERNYAKQSVNTAISKLVKQGYVSLIPDKTAPRNRKTIALTEAGEQFCDHWVRPVVEAEIKALAALSDEERELCIALRKKRYEILKDSLKDFFEVIEEKQNE